MSAAAPRERLIVNFHGIGEPWDGVPADERPYWCPRANWPAFADALAEVKASGPVDLEITFDDGNLSDLTDGLPVLAERGLHATFHICAGRLGAARYLSDAQVRELVEAGMGIGSHGWNHVDLRRVDDAELQQEAEASRSRISEAGGTEVTRFAIPFGSYDRRVLRALRGYPVVYSSDRQRAPRDGWLTPRMSYVTGWRPDDLLRFATERYPAALRARRRIVGVLKRLR